MCFVHSSLSLLALVDVVVVVVVVVDVAVVVVVVVVAGGVVAVIVVVVAADFSMHVDAFHALWCFHVCVSQLPSGMLFCVRLNCSCRPALITTIKQHISKQAANVMIWLDQMQYVLSVQLLLEGHAPRLPRGHIVI